MSAHRLSFVAITLFTVFASVRADAHAQKRLHESRRCLPAAEPAPPPLRGHALELDTYLREYVQAFEVPGAAVALVEDGEIAYEGAFGVRDLATAEAVTVRTRFAVASLTKSMTSMALAALVDEGELDWENPVVEYLPGFFLRSATAGADVTLRHLLSHSTGIEGNDTVSALRVHEPSNVVAWIGQTEVDGLPGERYRYSNQAYALAGFVGARAAGGRLRDSSFVRGYERLIRKRVFEPIGMRRATLDFERASRSRDRATPHGFALGSSVRVAPGPLSPNESLRAGLMPAGAAWASIDDVARFALTQVNDGVGPDGNRVVSSEALRETRVESVEVYPRLGYAMGWMVEQGERGLFAWHSGGVGGYAALMATVPDEGWAIVVLTNRERSGRFAWGIVNFAWEMALGLPHQGYEAQAAGEVADIEALQAFYDSTLPVTDEVASGLVGDYAEGVRVWHAGDVLVLDRALSHGEFRLRADGSGFVGVGMEVTEMGLEFSREGEEPASSLTLGLQSAPAAEMTHAVTLARQCTSPQKTRMRQRAPRGR